MKRLPSWITVLPSLVVPVCTGLSLYLGLQYLIETRAISDETTLRYLTGHPVSKITVGMFLIGLSSLLVMGWNLITQFAGETNISLGEVEEEETPSQDTRELAVDHGQYLLDLPDRYHSHYLWERLVGAVHSIYRTGTTATVEEELKYLSDMDQERQQQRYSLARILIWATPMLGFLGTVLGISQALGGIAIGPENDFQQMMNGLRGSLYIAFDTTALALTLSMLLMFGLFLIERFESQLLRLVDQRARTEIARHYEIQAAGSFESTQVVEAIQNVVVSQTEIWRESISKAEQAWMSTLTQTSDIVRNQLTESLDENIAALAHYLGEAIEKADMSISHRWSQWQVSLSENTRLMEKHLLTLGTQTESVQKIVASLGSSTAFDEALQHQKDAVMATTRTHRVLNELLEKVEQAGMLDSAYNAATAKVSAVESVVESVIEATKVKAADMEAVVETVVEAAKVKAAGVEAAVEAVSLKAADIESVIEAAKLKAADVDAFVEAATVKAVDVGAVVEAATVKAADVETVVEAATVKAADVESLVVTAEGRVAELESAAIAAAASKAAEAKAIEEQKALDAEAEAKAEANLVEELENVADDADSDTLVVIFSKEDVVEEPTLVEAAAADETPVMKIFEADEVEEVAEVQSQPAAEVVAAPQTPVTPSPKVVAPRTATPVLKLKLNRPNSAQVARALAEGNGTDSRKPEVAFRNVQQHSQDAKKTDSQSERKRAA